LVGEARVRDRGPPAQALRRLAADRVEAAVDLGVDAADEEGGHGRDAVERQAARGPPLEAGLEGLGHGGVALEREDEGDVDADPLGRGRP
jgi:hypothetical protein